METGQIIKLTAILYKVTDAFPKEEPLRCQVREKANNILENLIMILSQNPIETGILQRGLLAEKALSEIKILRAFLEVARHQEWANGEYITVVGNEYGKLSGFLQAIPKKEQPQKQEVFRQKPKASFQKESNMFVLEGKDRCKKIIEVLRQGKAAQVRDIQNFFPKVTKRTLRRDFEFLVGQGLVRRRGDKNNTEYVLR